MISRFIISFFVSIVMVLFLFPLSGMITTTTLGQSINNDDTVLSQIYDKTINSVVSVIVRVPVQGGIYESTGSGFVYDNQGHIITNDHVIDIGSVNKAEVDFIDGNRYTADIIGKDVYSDLAVLQLQPSVLTMEHSAPISLSSSASVKIGQHVIAIGNPLGQFTGTMTEGIVSQLNRMISGLGNSFQVGMIQTDAPITHGNSGGPLLNLDDQVIGVTSATSANATFISFAIPSDTVQKIVPQLIAHGSYSHPWLGISGIEITPTFAYLLSLNQANGILVTYVAPGSPAALAGISSGSNIANSQGGGTTVNKHADIILGVDNKPVRGMVDLLTYVDTKSVGDSIVLRGIRDGVAGSVTIHLIARPDSK